MPTTALILAAGRSERMGQPKAWLTLEGETLLERALRVTNTGGCDHVIVVAGAKLDATLASRQVIDTRIALDKYNAEIVIGEPNKTQIDSIRRGLERLPEASSVLLWPVDHPFADSAVVEALIQKLGDSKQEIILPSVDGRRAHPVLFGQTPAQELRTTLADRGANEIVRRLPGRVLLVDCADARLVANLNTPDEAAAVGVLLRKESG